MLTTFRRSRFVAIGLLAAFTLAACGGSSSPRQTGARSPSGGHASSGFPVTVLSAEGPVVVRSRPTAIVSLSPTATEMAYAIGAGSQVKAVDKYSDYPPGTPQTKLSSSNLNVESVIALKPDLVVVGDVQGALKQRLAALSIPVLVLPAAQKLDDVYTQMSELGQATGHIPQATSRERSIRTRLQRIVASVPHRATPATYYYELTPDSYSVTSDTFIGHLFALLGMKSIADSAAGAAKSGGYPQLSAEYVVKADPGFIFLADTVCCQQSVSTIAGRPGWSTMRAVRLHHIVPLNDDIASRWGPRIVVLLQQAANALTGRSS